MAAPVGHPNGIMGNRLCWMFQTGALGRTGGSFCPTATGNLTVFNSNPLLFQRGSKNRWCRSVCALRCQFPRRIYSVHLIPQNLGVVVLLRRLSEQLHELWSPPAPAQVPAAPFQTIDATHEKLRESGSCWKSFPSLASSGSFPKQPLTYEWPK